ncbi:MAG: HmuY family protein [Cyclobacteriaceae bacterium]|jgi:hypothetical protein|nr:HmuY family protein [Cyclobacteriaceae bacterium]
MSTRFFKSIWFMAAVVLVLMFSSCEEDEPAAALEAITVRNLNADHAPFGPNPPARVGETKKFTFFSFRTGQIVTRADSATVNWDVAFQGTSIIFNSGTSGPGNAGAQFLSGSFEEVTEAPESGYVVDNAPIRAVSSSPLPPGATPTNQWWQNSGTGQSTVVSPIAGRILVVRLAQGGFAKMEILSYYKDAPVTPNNMRDIDRHYTFRYLYQPNGGRTF